MANLNETDLWEAGIYQLEEDDPVLGGPAGIDNLAPRQLASRTRYQRLRNVTPWDATLPYPANVAYVSYGGTTWKSVGESLNVAPGTDAAKWVRWAYTEGELAAALGDAVGVHEAKVNPHPQYATDDDLSAHANAANPHAQYVRHDAAQGLTAPQATQARTNISAETAGTAVSEIQKNAARYGVDTGAANAAVVAYVPAITALTDGMELLFAAAATNTGATTLNVNGLGAKPVVGGAHSVLQGGEIIANGKCMVVYNATLNSFVLIECTGAALQVGAATKSQHAATLAQLAMGTRVKGLAGNTVSAGSTTATFSAAEVLMRSPTTGASVLAQTVGPIVCDVATAGPAANGRDQAAAFATGAWVHYHFIWNGATVATIASLSATAPTLPAGYTHSAYAATMLMGAGILTMMRYRGDKAFYDAGIQVLAGAGNTTETLVSVSTVTPPNAPTMLLMVNMGLATSSSGPAGSNLGIRHTSGSTFATITNSVAVANQTAWNSAELELPNLAQQFYFLFFNETTPASLAARQAFINVVGFTLPNGG